MPWDPITSSSWARTRSIGSAVAASSPRRSPTWTCRPRRRSDRTEAATTTGDPIASMPTCAPPSVTVRTSSTAASRSWASTPASAPSRRACSRASADTSTATTRAPRARPTMTAESPTPPHPNTASHCPGRTRPCACTARNAVANRQPSAAASTNPSRSGSRTTLVSAAGTTTCSANEPGPVNPGWYWSGQTWASPTRQNSHTPQPQTNGAVTRSPTATRITPSPTRTTSPANSWPGTCGSETGSCPRQACQSDRHTPVARTATTTAPAGQSGSGTERTTGSCPYASKTTARTAAPPHVLIPPGDDRRPILPALVTAGVGRPGVGRSVRRPAGQVDLGPQAPGRRPREAYVAAAAAHQLADDREAKAGPPGVAGAGVVEPGEPFEDPLAVGLGDPRAVVVDPDQHAVPVPRRAEPHLGTGMPARVVDQVVDDTTQLVRMGPRGRRRPGPVGHGDRRAAAP